MPRSLIYSYSGRHLDAGSHIEARIAGLACNIIDQTPTLTHCITSKVPESRNSEEFRLRRTVMSGTLQMTFDNAVLEFPDATYDYMEDPTVLKVSACHRESEVD